MVKIGIIGLVSHTEISKYFSNSKILEYVESVYNEYITRLDLKKSDIILVSNGYPWINHIPVSLFLSNSSNVKDGKTSEPYDEYAGIELCMPTDLNPKTRQFLNTHEGRSLNESHTKYKEVSSIDSLDNLARILQAKKPNKKSIIKRGFKQANTLMVRNCDHVLVFGFGESPEGELWDKILCVKEYWNISKL